MYFNPRTHVGCDTLWPTEAGYRGYFNPRTHVGCDFDVQIGDVAQNSISIHAPTWGATLIYVYPTSFLFNFNPRTHVGCDHHSRPKPRSRMYFNPRTHVGCDLSVLCGVVTINNFNPRTHVGCDTLLSRAIIPLIVFQSTHPRGVRPTTGLHHYQYRHFNPRTHVGCDFRKAMKN